MTNLERLSNVPVAKPIWDGPESSSRNGGVTQSLLGKHIACPARFKALVIDNLRPRWGFSHRIEYGNMFHLCDELFQSGGDWKTALSQYVGQLTIHYPFDQGDILKWYRVCQIQFPVYLDYWQHHHESVTRIPLLQEQVFHVPYKLPSGRTVYLRGKWDGVELDGGIWLNESKTKGDVDPVKIERRLCCDIQTMFYLIALREELAHQDKSPLVFPIYPIKGVKYNVIRRPLSGGKGTIKQTKNETVDGYWDRLAQYIKDEPEKYFFRWQTEVSPEDIVAFERNTLIPCLERLCWWWDNNLPHERTDKISSISLLQSLNFTMPFGCPVISDEYGSEYDEYVTGSGSSIGLEPCTDLFPELNGE